MKKYPTIETERLLLRKFKLRDAKDMERILRNKKVLKTTSMSNGYEEGMPINFINRQENYFQRGFCLNMAIVLKSEDRFIGAIGFNEIYKKHNRADLGYYLDEDYWGQGLGTEAVRGIIEYGFSTLDLHKIAANVILPNPASRRILEKMGMVHEGTFKEQVRVFGEYKDLVWYGLLQQDYKSN